MTEVLENSNVFSDISPESEQRLHAEILAIQIAANATRIASQHSNDERKLRRAETAEPAALSVRELAAVAINSRGL